MTQHHYDCEIVETVGIQAAVIFRNFRYWVEANAAADRNKRNGLHWSYNSITQLTRLFPYMSRDKIRYALKKLEQSGLLIVAEFNKMKADKTKWYSVDYAVFERMKEEYSNKYTPLLQGNSAQEMAEDDEEEGGGKIPAGGWENSQGGWENSQMPMVNFPNGGGKIPKPIPDINIPDINIPNINPPNPPRGESEQAQSSVGKSYSDNFLIFWEAIKTEFESVGCSMGSKSEALKEFKKLKPEQQTIDRWIEAAKRQAGDKLSRSARGEFAEQFQHVSRWLKNKRFDDEVQIGLPALISPAQAGRAKPAGAAKIDAIRAHNQRASIEAYEEMMAEEAN